LAEIDRYVMQRRYAKDELAYLVKG